VEGDGSNFFLKALLPFVMHLLFLTEGLDNVSHPVSMTRPLKDLNINQ